MKVTWIGHSCFKVEEGGFSVILDPYSDGSVPGLAPVREEANLVLCSHQHGDHNAAGNVTVKAGADGPFRVSKIETWHDDKEGTLRGPNTIHVLETDRYKVVHFGDIGCPLTPDQAAQLAGADLVLIPVGGFYTVDAAQAAQIVKAISPKAVIPMHYRGDGFGFDVIGEVEAFTGQFSDVRKVSGCEVTLEGEAGETGHILVLTPRNKI